MFLLDNYSMKCKVCGNLFSRGYTLSEHVATDHCDGPLHLWCTTCNTFVPETGCDTCEEMARIAAEKKEQDERRQREIATKKRAIKQVIKDAKSLALSAVIKKKCRSDGGIYPPDYTDEEHHDKEMCDGHLEFYCETCSSFQDGPICGTCEQNALDARTRAEERERLIIEREARERAERERREKRRKAYMRAITIPLFLVLVLQLLCLAMMIQLFVFGEFVMPYTAEVLVGSFAAANVSALSILISGLFWNR